MERRSSYCACVFLRAAVLLYVTLLLARSRSVRRWAVRCQYLRCSCYYCFWWRSTLRQFLMSPSASQAKLWPTNVDLSTVGNAGDNIVTVLCVTLTWPHVVVVVRVSIVETGLSLMELYCHPLVPVTLLL